MPRQAQAQPAVAMALPTPGSSAATQTSPGRAEGAGASGSWARRLLSALETHGQDSENDSTVWELLELDNPRYLCVGFYF